MNDILILDPLMVHRLRSYYYRSLYRYQGTGVSLVTDFLFYLFSYCHYFVPLTLPFREVPDTLVFRPRNYINPHPSLVPSKRTPSL